MRFIVEKSKSTTAPGVFAVQVTTAPPVAPVCVALSNPISSSAVDAAVTMIFDEVPVVEE